MAEPVAIRVQSPAYQAYQVLHLTFVIAPLVAGFDKFTHFLVNWDQYLSPAVPRLGLSAHTFMLGVGLVEIIAGFLVAFAPRIGAWVVCVWLCGIILNLLSIPGYFDIALRDLGLALCAAAFARLSEEYGI